MGEIEVRGFRKTESDKVFGVPRNDLSEIGNKWCTKNNAIIIEVVSGLKSTCDGIRTVKSSITGKTVKRVRV